MAKFKVGDKVRVVSNGSRYDTFTAWFAVNREHLETEWLVKYRYDDDDNITGDVCTVLYCAPHPTRTHDMLYFIKHGADYVYLIGEAGIEITSRKMTLADIEKELGYRIELIRESGKNE